MLSMSILGCRCKDKIFQNVGGLTQLNRLFDCALYLEIKIVALFKNSTSK